MSAHEVGLPLVGVTARLEIRVGAGEGELAVTGLVNIVDFECQQASFLVQEELGIVGGRLEDWLHDFEELLRLVEFRGREFGPYAVEEFGDLIVRHHGTFVDEALYEGRIEGCLNGVEVVAVADPERHLPVKSDDGFSSVVLLFRLRDVDHRAPFALQNNIEAETVVIELGLQLEIER